MAARLALTLVVYISSSGFAQGFDNVALGKRYTCSSPGGIAWRGLLDGDRESDEPPGCFATGDDRIYPKKIIIDLGAVYEVDQIIVYNSANGNTRQVELWTSREGVNYDRVRQPYVFPNKTAQQMSAKFPPQPVRYVKIALLDTYGGGLGGDHILFLREVEVMGRPTAATAKTQTRPPIDVEVPRSARIFHHYVLQEGARVKLLILGDDAAVGKEGEGGLGKALADELKRQFALGAVELVDRSQTGYTALEAASYPISSVDESPDLVIVALGTADSLAFDPASFRDSMKRTLTKIQDRTHAMIVVVVPPEIPHSPSLGRAEECAAISTADVAYQLLSLVRGTEIAIVDAAEAIEAQGLDISTAYRDNLSLSSAGHRAIAAAVCRLFL
ncbi:MAG: GDSL-type esterase/lipase family protein [Candidatus Zipacnadales bacterium]